MLRASHADTIRILGPTDEFLRFEVVGRNGLGRDSAATKSTVGGHTFGSWDSEAGSTVHDVAGNPGTPRAGEL
jgi:hypothetical protein